MAADGTERDLQARTEVGGGTMTAAAEQAPDDLARRTATGSVAAVLAQVARILLRLAAMIFLGRLLSPEEFGVVGIAAAITGTTQVIADFGLSVATVQRRSVNDALVSALFYVNLGTGIAAAFLLWMLSDPVAAAFGVPELAPVLAILGLVVPLTSAGLQHAAILQRGMRMVPLEWSAVAAQAVAAVLAVGLAWGASAGAWALVAQALAMAGMTTVLHWSFAGWRPGSARGAEGVGAALAFGGNLAAYSFCSQIHRQFDDAAIGWRWGAAELGFYGRAYTLFMVPLNVLTYPASRVVLPGLSRLQDRPLEFRRLYLTAVAAVTLASAPVTGVALLAAEPIILGLFGPQWDLSVPLFRALTASMLLQPLYSSGGWILLARGHSALKLKLGLFSAAWFVTAFLIGVNWGAMGVALAYSTAALTLVPIWMSFATRGTEISGRDLVEAAAMPVIATLAGVGAAAAAGYGAASGIAEAAEAVAIFGAVFAVVAGAGYALWPAARAPLGPAVRTAKGILIAPKP